MNAGGWLVVVYRNAQVVELGDETVGAGVGDGLDATAGDSQVGLVGGQSLFWDALFAQALCGFTLANQARGIGYVNFGAAQELSL